MTGYTRQSLPEIQDGEDIVAQPLNDEFDALANAFDSVTGHGHSGGTGDGPPIDTMGLATNAVTTVKITDNAVTLAKIQEIPTMTILGNNTGGTTEVLALTNAQVKAQLDLEIGTDVQAFDAGLTSIAGLTTLADRSIYTTASDTYAVYTLTSFARTMLDDTTAGGVRTTLGLGDLAVLNTVNNGNWSGTDLEIANGGTGSSSASGARTNLGLGTAAVENTGTSGANIPFLNGANTWSGTSNNFNHTTVPGININRTNGSNNSVIEFMSTAGSVYAGNADGVTFAIGANAGNLAGANWFNITSSLATFNGAVNVVSDSVGPVTITGTAPGVSLNDTTTSNLRHRMISSSEDLAFDCDLNGLQASSAILFRIDGTEIARLASTGDFYLDGSIYFGNSGGNDFISFNDTDNEFTFTSDAAANNSALRCGEVRIGTWDIGGNSSVRLTQTARNFERGTTASVEQITLFNPNGSVGSVATAGSGTAFNTSSDKRKKQNWVPIDTNLIDQLDVWNFEWIVDGTRGHGVLAQDVLDIVPNAVSYNEENDLYSVDYSKYVPLLIAVIKELRAKVNGS